MKTFTINDIRNLNPCYDPIKWIPEGWTGTALDVLRMDNVPAKDRIWCVCHHGIIDDRTLRLFAVWCAREALKLVANPDAAYAAAHASYAADAAQVTQLIKMLEAK